MGEMARFGEKHLSSEHNLEHSKLAAVILIDTTN